MNIIKPIILSSVLLIIFITNYRALAEPHGGNPHELGNGANNTACTICHRQPPAHNQDVLTRVVLPDTGDFLIDYVTMCIGCHEGSEGTHPLGVRPKYPVPADLPLDRNGGITCLTCHYTHGSLKSDIPCCSVSFIDRLLDRSRMKKSFLLRRTNLHGELCKACHIKYNQKGGNNL